MTEPTRATRAASYLDMLGIRPRSRARRREPEIEIGEARVEPDVDVEIGEAQMQAPPIDFRGAGSSDPEAIAASTIARLEAQQPVTQARQATQRAALERDVDRDQRRSAAYDRSLIDGLVMDSDNLEALRAGTVQGVTLGFGDELAGAARSPFDRQAQPRGFAEARPATYESARDEVRRANETARAAAPRAYAGGEVLGGMLPALALPASRAETALGRIASSGLMGGALGGAQGYGHAEGDEQLDDAVQGAGLGFVAGAGGQAIGEIGGAVGRYFRGAPEGTPRPGGDFTPEQQAQIERDPAVRQMDSRRGNLELEAAARRVRSANPNITPAELEQIEATYEGGVRGLARDMDASGIAPRRSYSSPDTVQARAADAARAPAAQAGQFNDDVVRQQPPSGRTPTPSRWTDDIPADPHDAAPFDPNDTLEMQMRRAFEAEGRNTGAATQVGTAPRVRVGPRGERPIEFAEGMRAGETRGRPEVFVDDVEPVIASRAPATPQPAPSALVEDEPIDFAMDVQPRQGAERALDDRGAARVQANVRAAERRARRGGYSESTHDERTWPVRMGDIEDITPPAAAPAQPPPLPRRPPPAQDLGRWEAPPVEPPATPQAPAPRTPGQRAGEVLAPMQRRDTFARVARDEGVLAAPRRTVEDLAMRWLPVDSTRASLAEFRSDAMANEIMRRLSASPSTNPFRRALAAAAERGPRSFGVTLVSLANRHPEVATALEPLLQGTTQGAEGAMSASPIDPETGVPYADVYEGGQAPTFDDGGEDVDYGVPYADEYDERGQVRTQQRRQ